MKNKCIQQEIARLANCSVTQVSRALNGRGRISAATREKVLKIAAELNYRNTSRRPLRVALLRGEDYFIHLIFNTLDSLAALNNIQLLVLSLDDIDFLRQLPVEMLVFCDVPEDVSEKTAAGINVPKLAVRVFTTGNADLVMTAGASPTECDYVDFCCKVLSRIGDILQVPMLLKWY